MCTDNELRTKIEFFKICRDEEKRNKELKQKVQAEILEEFKVRRIEKFEKAKQVITIRETASTKAVKENFPDIWEKVKNETISEYIRV